LGLYNKKIKNGKSYVNVLLQKHGQQQFQYSKLI